MNNNIIRIIELIRRKIIKIFFYFILSIILLSHSACDKSSENVNSFDKELIEAARNGDVKAVYLLIDSGADANAGLGNGVTVLSIAKQIDYREIIELLIENRAIE